MPATLQDQEMLVDSLLAKIYNVVTKSDNQIQREATRRFTRTGVAPNVGPYLSFVVPGIPVKSLNFMTPTTPAMMAEAAGWSHVFNMIPTATSIWSPTNRRIWDIYQLCLDNAKLAIEDLSAEEQRQLQAAQNYLYTVVSYNDPITGQVVEEQLPNRPVQQYEKYWNEYDLAYNAYVNLKYDYLRDPNDPAKLQKWNELGAQVQQRVGQKISQWNSEGHRRRVEEVRGLISQLTGRGPNRVWERMRTDLELSRRIDPNGIIYYPTFAFPSDILSAPGWDRITFSSSETTEYSHDTKVNWGGGGGFDTGLWGASANASYKSEKTYRSADISNASFEMEIAQAPILRPWLNTWIYSSRAWKGGALIGGVGSISNGELPPNAAGQMPLLPVSAILVRNVKISVDWSKEVNRTEYERITSEASGHYGPFTANGNYSREESEKYHFSRRTANGFEIAGPQIIGFVCEVIPKSPWPDEDTFHFPDDDDGFRDREWLIQGSDLSWLQGYL